MKLDYNLIVGSDALETMRAMEEMATSALALPFELYKDREYNPELVEFMCYLVWKKFPFEHMQLPMALVMVPPGRLFTEADNTEALRRQQAEEWTANPNKPNFSIQTYPVCARVLKFPTFYSWKPETFSQLKKLVNAKLVEGRKAGYTKVFVGIHDLKKEQRLDGGRNVMIRLATKCY